MTSDDTRKNAMCRVKREQIINDLKLLPRDIEVTTKFVTERVGCKEYQARAAISWLVLGGLMTKLKKRVRRKDDKGRSYYVNVYRWTGKDSIHRVPHDIYDRQRLKEQVNKNMAADLFLFGAK